MTKLTRYAAAGLVIFAVLFSYNYAGAEPSDGTPLVLIKTKEDIASAFSRLNEYVSSAASDISKTGLTGPVQTTFCKTFAPQHHLSQTAPLWT